MTSPDTPDRFLIPREAAAYLRVSVSWLAKARMRGDGPPYVKIGRAVRYPESGLREYAAANKRRSTSDTGGRRSGRPSLFDLMAPVVVDIFDSKGWTSSQPLRVIQHEVERHLRRRVNEKTLQEILSRLSEEKRDGRFRPVI